MTLYRKQRPELVITDIYMPNQEGLETILTLRRDDTPIVWLRIGAASGMLAVAVQSVWDTGLRMPANAVLFALIAAVAVHDAGEPGLKREPGAARRTRP